MRKIHTFIQNSPALLIVAALLFTTILFTTLAQAQADSLGSIDKRPFDFNDRFYLDNGINPAQIINKRTGADGFSVFDVAPTRDHSNVRVKVTMPAYDHSGNLQYWYLLGEIFQTGFVADSNGEEAARIAEAYKIFVFPKANGNGLALGNNRQANVVDMRNDYFTNNPLGIGRLVFVNYTRQAATNSNRILSALAQRNGLSTDGTPIIKTTGELQDLLRHGFITQTVRALDGSQGPAWLLHPVIADPSDGAIALDAFLNVTRNADGSPLTTEKIFSSNFSCLKRTGYWCRN